MQKIVLQPKPASGTVNKNFSSPALSRLYRIHHRHLKLRTGGRRSRVREFGSIQLSNVTSANVIRFLPNFVHITIQSYGTKGSKFGNFKIYIYDFIKPLSLSLSLSLFLSD